MNDPRQRPATGAAQICLKVLLLLSLLATSLSAGGCWLWEPLPSPQQTPAPTSTPPAVEEAGSSSPSIDGRLLYAAAGHIWLRAGTTARRLTEETTGTQPAWSPNGRQIAFVVRGEYYSDIWIMDADGGNAYAITNSRAEAGLYSYESVHGSYWVAQPQWIPPGGLWLSFLSHGSPDYKASVLSVWIMHPDGAERRRYLGLSQHIESPVWSPDGEWLAFTLFLTGRPSQLRVLDPDGNIRSLGPDSEEIARYDPAWSPDGLWIVYAAREGEQGPTDLWLMPSPLNALYEDEWSPVRLTAMGQARNPAWSPDGRQIAFIAAERQSFDLWLLNLDLSETWPRPAGKAERLTDGGNVDATSRPSWAP